MNLSNPIRQALLTLLKEKLIIASWGISNISVKENDVCFTIDGFKYKGTVAISAHGNGYDIKMNEFHFFCELDSLVNKLDEFIEKSTDYEERIEDLLSGI